VITINVVVAALLIIALALALRIVEQYEAGVMFRLGRIVQVKNPGLAAIISIADRMRKVTMRIITMPIQSQGVITKDNVTVDISAVACFRVIDAVRSVVAIEDVDSAIDQIAQTTLRKVVGITFFDQMLAKTDVINADMRKILDASIKLKQ